MISFTQPVPLQRAVDSVSNKTPLGTALGSEQIRNLPVKIRQRAFFSAKVEKTRLLAQMQNTILRRLRLERRVLADGAHGTYQRRDQFLLEMQQLAESYGLRPTDEKRGTIQDIGSYRRLRLIWDTQIKMAQGYSEWKMGQDKDVLDAAPAQELIRVSARRMERPWQDIWRDAIRSLGKETTAIMDANGRMYALKSDIIWTYISYFKQPWPPFNFNSGMGVRNVRRRKTEKLGLIKKGEKPVPNEMDFNDGLAASVAGMNTDHKQDLKEYFGDLAEIDEERNVIEWKGEQLDTMLDRAQRRVAGETFDKKLKAISFGKIDATLAEKIKKVTAYDVEDYRLILTEDNAYHILNRHGDGKETRSDQRPINIDDFYFMLTSWRNPKEVTYSDDKTKPLSVKTHYDFHGNLIGFLWNMIKGQKILNLNTLYAKK